MLLSYTGCCLIIVDRTESVNKRATTRLPALRGKKGSLLLRSILGFPAEGCLTVSNFPDYPKNEDFFVLIRCSIKELSTFPQLYQHMVQRICPSTRPCGLWRIFCRFSAGCGGVQKLQSCLAVRVLCKECAIFSWEISVFSRKKPIQIKTSLLYLI